MLDILIFIKINSFLFIYNQNKIFMNPFFTKLNAI